MPEVQNVGRKFVNCDFSQKAVECVSDNTEAINIITSYFCECTLIVL